VGAKSVSSEIFISHAVKDKGIADALVDLLLTSTKISSDQIFCSSLEGLGIPPGVNFVDYIKGKIQEPKAVIALISPNYLGSQFCMCELGATWAMSHDLLPLLVPPLTFEQVKGVLTGVQLARIDESTGLSELTDRLLTLTGTPVGASSRWEVKRNAFLTETLPKILKKIKNPVVVSEVDYKRVQQDYNESLKEMAAYEKMVAELRSQIADLSQLKDRKQVTAVMRKHSSGADTLDALVTEFSAQLTELPAAVSYVAFAELGAGRRVIMNTFKDHDFVDAAARAIDEQFLTIGEGDVCLNDRHPQIRKLNTAFQELNRFISYGCPADVVQGFEDENNIPMTLENRAYWEYALDTRIKKFES
jgi:hypothetical protein